MKPFARSDRVGGQIQKVLSEILLKKVKDPRLDALGYVKRTLARQLGLRYMPDLKFFFDESFDYGSHIDKVLKAVKADNGPNNTLFEK